MTYVGYRQVPADEKGTIVQQHFTTIASRYDLMNNILSFGLHHFWKRTALKILGLKAGDLVIDVCGGTADLALLAAREIGYSGKVIVYDMNQAMIDRGRHKAVNSPYGRIIEFVQGDAEQIACSDYSFHAALVGFGVRNLTHMEKGFREMYRILKPGGKMMCLEFSRPSATWFRLLYDLYSFIILPLTGKVLAGSKEAYTYLFESIRMFPSPESLTSLLEEIGFSQVTFRRLTRGVAVIHLGMKA
jgi:demethylmenaquinone methyltransferase/2-methoxy-6-polyprenyl-1,4-benzoquinol methylase